MTPDGGPYAWQPHLLPWAVLAVGTAAVVVGHRRLQRGSEHPLPWSPREQRLFAGSLLAAVVALTWPLADLAAHWSLAALVLQRLILVLAVAPLLLLGLPYDVLRSLTRAAVVDALLTRMQRPPVAVVVVTVLVVGSMTPALVRAQSDSLVARGVLDVVLVGAGLALWIPVLGRIPGILRPKPVVRFGYLIVQAVVPAFLSFLYIFSTRPLYPSFARSHEVIGLRPLNDQQIAGFLSKLTMLLVLLIVGAVVLARADTAEEEFGPDVPLVWADVERQFERADRRGSPPAAATPDRQGPEEAGKDPDGQEGDRSNWTGPPDDPTDRNRRPPS